MLSGLWRHSDFVKLWLGHSISRFGSEISQLAIPLTAALVLNATALQMGLLAAIEFAPFLVLALFAGVWVDRLPRRPILIWADVGRAGLLGSIPVAAVLRVLSIEQLYVVALGTGILTVFFDVADQAYLPALVGREDLIEGNSKLEVSRSVAQITGPGVAGVLVQTITAPMAVAVDAASFVASVICLFAIRKPEPPPVSHGQAPQSIWADIKEGLAVVLTNPVLRSIAACTGSGNLFNNAMMAVYVLYLTRELRIEPAVIGLIFAISGPGALFGALVAGRTATMFGLGRTIIVSSALFTVAGVLVALASGPPPVVIATLMLAAVIGGISNPVYNINQVSLRQAITPDRLQGRMNASMRFIVWGTIPIGALLGGALGDAIGLRPTLIFAALGQLLPPLFVIFSPVRALKEQPTPLVEPVAAR
jgi:MFS family permease